MIYVIYVAGLIDIVAGVIDVCDMYRRWCVAACMIYHVAVINVDGALMGSTSRMEAHLRRSPLGLRIWWRLSRSHWDLGGPTIAVSASCPQGVEVAMDDLNEYVQLRAGDYHVRRHHYLLTWAKVLFTSWKATSLHMKWIALYQCFSVFLEWARLCLPLVLFLEVEGPVWQVCGALSAIVVAQLVFAMWGYIKMVRTHCVPPVACAFLTCVFSVPAGRILVAIRHTHTPHRPCGASIISGQSHIQIRHTHTHSMRCIHYLWWTLLGLSSHFNLPKIGSGRTLYPPADMFVTTYVEDWRSIWDGVIESQLPGIQRSGPGQAEALTQMVERVLGEPLPRVPGLGTVGSVSVPLGMGATAAPTATATETATTPMALLPAGPALAPSGGDTTPPPGEEPRFALDD
ncbi:hypothetical protein PAPYR_5849 [Paratrimastix pyriformis]|uniref:Uncharacterized protein n=1 Tax=Paratrimastix pyriformis TaxID=342808 RepID=A0ABQ8UGS2_9EUKA|nr:hypothetical protein PAPYR_5849 [Paratrimastix pyriformis]